MVHALSSHHTSQTYLDSSTNQPKQVEESKDKKDTSFVGVCKRVAFTALPFLSLYKPFSFPLAIAMGSLRCVSSISQLIASRSSHDPMEFRAAVLQTAISVAALACTIIAHPLGMIIIAASDMVQNIGKMIVAIEKGDYKKALEHGVHVLSDALFLTVFLYGSLELSVAFFAIQTLLALYHSHSEFKKGNFIEGLGHLGMSFVRGHQLYSQSQLLHYKYMLQNLLKKFNAQSNQQTAVATHNVEASSPASSTSSPMKEEGQSYVGELGEKWQFPSDHLPVGGKVGNVHVISWNILNKNFMSWVYQNTQGLNGSMITQLDKPSPRNPSITLREELVIKYLLEMMNDPRHSGNLMLALQECSPEFLNALIPQLPPHMGIVLSDSKFGLKDQNVVIYNKNTFRFLAEESSFPHPFHKSDSKRTLMDLVFEETATGQKYQLINAHLPGDPNLPGRNEFARYMLNYSKNDCITMAVGDMNFTDAELQLAFAQEAQKLHLESHFHNLVDYNTNVGAYTLDGKSIDHIWVDTKGKNIACEGMKPDEVLKGLQSTVDLLNPQADRQVAHALNENRFEFLRKLHVGRQIEKVLSLRDRRRYQYNLVK